MNPLNWIRRHLQSPPPHLRVETHRARMQRVEWAAAMRLCKYGDEDYAEWDREMGEVR